MKRTLIALFALSFILLSISSALADGGYFPHPGYWVRPGQQRAVIFHEDNTETMILTSSFQGNAKDLVWIVPTPSKPEVTKSSEKVFMNVANLARAQYNQGLELGAVMNAAKGNLESGGVLVIESKQVDYYDVNVLLATNTQDLVKWFNENNYSYPDAYSYVLKSYVDKGWYFTAIKVSPESQGATEVMQDLKEGNPTPIKMIFLSDKIVFPLKISSVDFPNPEDKKYGPARNEPIGATRKDKSGNTWTKVSNETGGSNWKTDAYGYQGVAWEDSLIDQQPGGISYDAYNNYRYSSYVPINLYVIADGKYEADGFYTQYGNWVKKTDIEKLGSDDKGTPYIQPKNNKYFLTSLSANYQKSQMDDDLILTKSDNNQKVNAGPETWQLFLYGLLLGLILFVVWMFTPLGIFFIIGTLILFFASNKVARTFGWILNIISFIVTLAIGIILFATAAFSNSLSNYMIISMLITCVFVLALMVIFMVLSRKYKRS